MLPKATLLHLGDEAIVQVTGLRTPCIQIDKYREGLQQHLWSERGADAKRTRRAGIMGVVLVGGVLRAGAEMRVELPTLPHSPLGPV